MKRTIAVILFLCLMINSTIAMAQGAVVDGKTGSKVHLRSRRSTSSSSLGLYFTGTPLVCEADPVGEWVYVTIGAESGYMKKDYLLMGSSCRTAATGKLVQTIRNGVSLLDAPGDHAGTITTLKKGTVMTLMGETSQHWYYVQTGDQMGYVAKDNVKSIKPAADQLPFAGETEWVFSSGAGAWHTSMTIEADGSFTGEHSDWDMGDQGKNYPNGTHYSCVFKGKFDVRGKAEGGTYRLQVVELVYERPAGEIRYVDGVREIATEAHGLSLGDQFLLCLTGTDESRLTENTRMWVRENLSEGRVVCPLLINLNEEWGFCIR